MKCAILAVMLALTSLACAARPPVAAPESMDGQGSTARPRLLNPEDLNRALEREYPRLLKERGIGGTTTVNVFIDEEGIVRNQLVAKSSGRKELDTAALRVVRVARFSPARNRDKKVAIWMLFDITFTPR